MKLFIVLSALAAVTVADPSSGLYGSPLLRTISPIGRPGLSALVGRRPLTQYRYADAGIPALTAPAFAAAPAFAPAYGGAAPALAAPAYGRAAPALAAPAYGRAAPALAAPALAAPAYGIAAPAVAAPAIAAPAIAAPALPSPVSSQFHQQDEFGNYEYGYSNPNSAKHEGGNAYTGVQGSYSYVDSYGLLQKVNYVADDFGFRATGTNFPTTPATLGLHRRRRSVGYSDPLWAGLRPLGYSNILNRPYAQAYSPRPVLPARRIAAPVYSAAPAIAAPAIAAPALAAPALAAPAYGIAAPAVAAPAIAAPAIVAPASPSPVSSQFHQQDEFGNYEYGYSNPNSAKHEGGNAYTGVQGSYSYVDSYGLLQKVNYVADDFGFRASGTNFPTTPANLGLHRRRRSVIPVVSAPATHPAILTTIQLNPNHAVAYRVF